MTEERKQEIREQCEAEALEAYPDREWDNSHRTPTQLRFHNERVAFVKGRFPERIRSEELIEAGSELEKFLTDTDQAFGLRVLWEVAISKYKAERT